MMGTHSTFFGPIKYAILPEILKPNELMSGNALFQSGTSIAILIGMILGGAVISEEEVLRGALANSPTTVVSWKGPSRTPRKDLFSLFLWPFQFTQWKKAVRK